MGSKQRPYSLLSQQPPNSLLLYYLWQDHQDNLLYEILPGLLFGREFLGMFSSAYSEVTWQVLLERRGKQY